MASAGIHGVELVILLLMILMALPPLIRRLGLAGGEGKNLDEEQARRAMTDAALAYLEQSKEIDKPEFASLYGDLIRFQQNRRKLIDADVSNQGNLSSAFLERYRDLSVM